MSELKCVMYRAFDQGFYHVARMCAVVAASCALQFHEEATLLELLVFLCCEPLGVAASLKERLFKTVRSLWERVSDEEKRVVWNGVKGES